MTYLAHDGSSRMVLKRDSEEEATKKAELRDMGWFKVEVVPQSLTKVAYQCTM